MPGNTNYQKTVLTAQNTTSGGRYEVFFEQKTNTGTNEIYVIIDEISPEEGAITSVRHEIN